MNRRILAVVVALVLAAIGTTGVLIYVRGAENRAAAGQHAINVLVVSERIPTGTTGKRIRSEGLATAVKMPASSVPADALTSVGEDLDDLVVTSDVQPNQLLLRGQFASPKRLAGGLTMPAGTVAVSIEAAVSAEVAGYVLPGADVAVFDTFTEAPGRSRVPSGDGLSRGAAANQVTRLLLPRVEVVAVGQRGAGGQTSAAGSAAGGEGASTAEKSKAPSSVLITVAVNQKEAEQLIHGVQTGSLYLALLSDTSKVTAGNGVDNRSLFK